MTDEERFNTAFKRLQEARQRMAEVTGPYIAAKTEHERAMNAYVDVLHLRPLEAQP